MSHGDPAIPLSQWAIAGWDAVLISLLDHALRTWHAELISTLA
jgi:hypothetical protein